MNIEHCMGDRFVLDDEGKLLASANGRANLCYCNTTGKFVDEYNVGMTDEELLTLIQSVINEPENEITF